MQLFEHSYREAPYVLGFGVPLLLVTLAFAGAGLHVSGEIAQQWDTIDDAEQNALTTLAVGGAGVTLVSLAVSALLVYRGVQSLRHDYDWTESR